MTSKGEALRVLVSRRPLGEGVQHHSSDVRLPRLQPGVEVILTQIQSVRLNLKHPVCIQECPRLSAGSQSGAEWHAARLGISSRSHIPRVLVLSTASNVKTCLDSIVTEEIFSTALA